MKLDIYIPKYVLELKPKEISRALGAAVRLVANQAKQDIKASDGSPGNAPKNRSGALVAAITSRQRKLSAAVISKDPGSTALSVGARGGGGNTRDKNNILFAGEVKNGKVLRSQNRMKKSAINKTRVMEARPFLEPALKKRKAEIERRLKKAIMEDIKFNKTK